MHSNSKINDVEVYRDNIFCGKCHVIIHKLRMLLIPVLGEVLQLASSCYLS